MRQRLALFLLSQTLAGPAPVQSFLFKTKVEPVRMSEKPHAPASPMRAAVTGTLKIYEKEVMRWLNRAVHGNGVGESCLGASRCIVGIVDNSQDET